MKEVIKFSRIKLKAEVKWVDRETTITPIFFPLCCEWIDNNSCSIFAHKITDFTISKRVKVIVNLFEWYWIVSIRWHRYFRYRLPYKIKQAYLRHTYINNQIPF